MKPRKNSLKYLICGAAAALSLIAVPAAAEQDSPRLTVAFISDAAQGKTITREQYDRAIAQLEDETQKGLRGFYAANNLCVSYLKVRDTERAQVACDTAVERIQYLVNKTAGSARRSTTVPEYERLLAIALSNRGVINFVNDKPELARTDFESAIATDSGIREAQVNLARITELVSADA
jgi:Flp pilus assembly protein TadD